MNKFTCHKCEESLPLNSDNFYRNKQNESGFSYNCKDCDKKYQAEQLQDHKLPKRVNKHKFNDTGFDNAASRDFAKRMLKPDVSVDRSIL